MEQQPENNTNQQMKQHMNLQKGKYVFMDNLEELYQDGSPVPALVAKAISISEKDGVLTGDVALMNVSDLILKQSSYIDENGRVLEAHKLYTWPRNLGSTKDWTASKIAFITQYILNFPIEVISTAENAALTWKFISPENFKNFPEGTSGSEAFQDFASHKEEYFFLRQPINPAQ